MMAAAVAKTRVFCAGLLRREAAHSSRSNFSGILMPKSSRSDRRVHSVLVDVVVMGAFLRPCRGFCVCVDKPRACARGYCLTPLPGLRNLAGVAWVTRLPALFGRGHGQEY